MSLKFRYNHALYTMHYLLLMCLFVACSSGRRYFPDNLQPAEVSIVRFDSALLSIDTQTEPAAVAVCRLYEEYPDFMRVFAEDILGIEAADTAFMIEALPNYLNDTVYGFAATNSRVRAVFADITDICRALGMAFARLQYIYPDYTVPEITFFVSGFNASLFFWGDMSQKVAVGVDMYLGADWEYYNRVVWNYQKQTMRKECIPADVVSACLFRLIPFSSSKSRLLENMVYRGKVMYLLSLLLPEEPQHEIMGYTKEQWQWAVKNERNVWNMIVDKRDLWKTESPVLTSYLNDGPFTTEISQEAPPRLGTFIGWRIAESYMTRNTGVRLQDLMSEGDAQKILEESAYRP